MSPINTDIAKTQLCEETSIPGVTKFDVRTAAIVENLKILPEYPAKKESRKAAYVFIYDVLIASDTHYEEHIIREELEWRVRHFLLTGETHLWQTPEWLPIRAKAEQRGFTVVQ